jgi:hypothetical protein
MNQNNREYPRSIRRVYDSLKYDDIRSYIQTACIRRRIFRPGMLIILTKIKDMVE